MKGDVMTIIKETVMTYQALLLMGIAFGWGLMIDRDINSTTKSIGSVITLVCAVIAIIVA